MAIVVALAAAGGGSASSRADGATGTKAALGAYGRLPLSFVRNAGQLDRRVRYSAQAGGANVFFTRSEAVLTLAKGKREFALQLHFLGSESQPALSAARAAPGRVSYLVGDEPAGWHRDLATYRELVYRRLWPGIALNVRGHSGRLEYAFRVAPGADPSRIRLAYRGERYLTLGRDGELRIHTSVGALRDLRPVSYQRIAGKRVPVESRFVLGRNGSYHFALGAYDHRYPLVIDPGLVYSTYLGGGDFDRGFGIAVDSDGNAYVSGDTASTDFPTTAGAFETGDTASTGTYDSFVTKLNPAGTAAVYSTYVGGPYATTGDYGTEIAVDSSGSAYITGVTDSPEFPTTTGAFQTSMKGPCDAFVAKLNPSGTALDYSTYLGGKGYENGPAAPISPPGIAVDSAGNAYVTGFTTSSDFPTTAGAYLTTHPAGGLDSVFVTELNSSGTGLVYSTYVGSGEASGLALDSSGDVYITGQTEGGYPTTPGAFQTTVVGGPQAFVTKLNPTGTALDYSTYLGGSGFQYPDAIAVDSGGHAYVTGDTSAPDFPTTAGAFQTSPPGGWDAYVTKLNTTGTGLDYSTYLGGTDTDEAFGIAVDSTGSAYLIGETESQNFPTTAGAFQTSPNGYDSPAFFTKLNPTGTALDYSTYLGGTLDEAGHGIAIDGAGDAYVTGDTQSSDFPTTAGAFQTSYGGHEDAFVTKIDPNATTYTLSVTKSGAGTGTVTSAPAGIDCGATCAHSYAAGTQVTLTAAAASGSTFTGWSGGGCSGTSTCKVAVNADTAVTATFAKVQCVVPNVKSKSLTAAKHAIAGGHCALGKVTEKYSTTVKKGLVMSQKPAAGSHLAQGAKVNLTVSRGKRK